MTHNLARPQVRPVNPGGYRGQSAALLCSILKGIHRWPQPFRDGDSCSCGALRLDTKPQGLAAFEVHDG